MISIYDLLVVVQL